MADTDAQLSDALTAQFVAVRGAVEAVLNRVTSIVTQEQIERLKLQELVETIVRRLGEIEAATHAATEQRAHLMIEVAGLRSEVAQLRAQLALREPEP
jgi:3-deoxy-D-manno-octulosonic-acid transferase